MKGILIAATVVILAGCATKNYGRQGELTDYEKNAMTCREMALEQAKVMGFLDHVQKESEFDGRSVLSFLGDFGIGNMMEKDNAIKSTNARLKQLQGVAAAKGCTQGAAPDTAATTNQGQRTDVDAPLVWGWGGTATAARAQQAGASSHPGGPKHGSSRLDAAQGIKKENDRWLSDGKEKSISIPSASRLKSSITLNSRMLRPSAN